MVKIAGLVSSKTQGKKRLHPSATTAESRREQHAMYQYAVDEYAQAVPPGTSNDDGNSVFSLGTAYSNVSTRRSAAPSTDESKPPPPPQPPAPERLPSTIRTKATAHTEIPPGGLPRIPFVCDIPDATYEEHYGEAYTGGPIKYIYPSGYQTMRPRSCPWKLSIFVCLLFTWLSIFIVGHCSDQVDQVDFTYDDAIDDDTLVIDIRWCGSRPLYLMWVASMLITGISAAYCGVIGYIKVRDFAVANSRSQPPGVLEGKSDYYVKIGSNIYQSDGAPQFWGSHIYKPTQAAVAVTSR